MSQSLDEQRSEPTNPVSVEPGPAHPCPHRTATSAALIHPPWSARINRDSGAALTRKPNRNQPRRTALPPHRPAPDPPNAARDPLRSQRDTRPRSGRVLACGRKTSQAPARDGDSRIVAAIWSRRCRLGCPLGRSGSPDRWRHEARRGRSWDICLRRLRVVTAASSLGRRDQWIRGREPELPHAATVVTRPGRRA